MRYFADIEAQATHHCGGQAALKGQLPKLKTQRALQTLSNDRWLSHLAKAVFSAGFSWAVVRSKWDDIDTCFKHFDPYAVAYLSDEDIEALTQDRRMIRHYKKIQAMRANAAWFVDIIQQGQSIGQWFTQFGNDQFVELLLTCKREGTWLGGNTAQYFLRGVGYDGFILTKDVTLALQREGVVDKPSYSKTNLLGIQHAFNQWHAETKLPFAHLSKILALSVG